MAQIELLDGSLHNILDEKDILSLVEEKMGREARLLLEEKMSEAMEIKDNRIEDLWAMVDRYEQKIEALREAYNQTMGEIREQLVCIDLDKKDIDRAVLSTAIGKISVITKRNLYAV